MDPKPFLQLSVHQLVDTLLRRGDIDNRVYNQETMQLGSKLHASFQEKQGNTYHAEVALAGTFERERGTIALQGRADGIIDGPSYPIIDEIKSTVADLKTFYEEQKEWHLGQALCYALMYLNRVGKDKAGIQLTYLSQNSDESMVKNFVFSKEEIEEKVYGYIDDYLKEYSFLHSHQLERDESIKNLKFPYPIFRQGQREMARYCYGVGQNGGFLFVEAPTGIGKTMSSLYPYVRCFKQGRADKIFYLTAKNTGAMSAYSAITDLYENGFVGFDSILTAKEKICFCPGHECNPDDCPFARGYYTKLKDCLHEMVRSGKRFDYLSLSEFCSKNQICPFEFQLDLSRYADIVICDYNYFYDPIVHLERYFDDMVDQSTFLVLTDEAHNLIERGRSMYSASLSYLDVKWAQKDLRGKDFSSLRKALKKAENFFLENEIEDYEILPNPPKEIVKAIDSIKRAQQALGKKGIKIESDNFRRFSREANRYVRLLELLQPSTFRVMLAKEGEDIALRLQCLDASPYLKSSLQSVKGAVLFSATLSPMDFYQEGILGSNGYSSLNLSSPFPKENFHLMVAPKISVRYKDRDKSYAEVADYLNRFVNAKKGNYFLYFPSFEYMENIRPYLEFPGADVLPQGKAMTQEERSAFLDNFVADPEKTTVGLLILGGAFSEGIDLVSDRLIGVCIVGVGIPQIGIDNDLIRSYYQEKSGNGYAFAYKNPGINKVMQAIGRLIRSETDVGAALLIDDRYLHRNYREIITKRYPQMEIVTSAADMEKSLTAFFMKK